MDIEIISAGGKKVNAYYKGFTIETDQSLDNGGEGKAPEPFSLFLASIGTCAGIYVYVFCQTRNIPTDNIKIIQRMQRNDKTRMIDKILLEIQLPDDFPDKYRDMVIRSANKCSVKKHIQQAPEFEVYTIKNKKEL